MAPTHARPWSLHEHERFLDALEKYGCGQSTSVFAAWHAIAATVATRSVQDVKAHARRYYAQLQAANAQRRREFLAMQQIDSRWTRDQDARLEDELATHIPTSASYPWKAIARRVPGKTPRDARERYVKLCYDISRIESGQHVMMHLGRHPGQRRRDAHLLEQDEDPAGIDCVVSLTAHEKQLLLAALERVPVPPHAAPEVLAAVASAVAALASTRNKKPPRRATPLFSIDEACHALRAAIDDELSEPVDVLELLAHELELLPVSSQHSRAPTPTPVSGSAGLRLRMSSPAATEPPRSSFRQLSPPIAERDAGEELLTHLRTSPVHGHPVARRLRISQFDHGCPGHADASSFPFPAHASSSFPYSLIPTATREYTPRGQDCEPRHRSDYMMDDFL